MIIIRFHGGLGNQMYEYVFYEYMEKRYPGLVKADLTWFDRNRKEHQGYELERVFGIRVNEASYEEVARIHEYYPHAHALAAVRFLARKYAAYRNRKRQNEEHYIFDFGPTQYGKNERFDYLDPAEDWYIEGVYCSDAYLRTMEPEIRNKLVFRPPLGKNNEEILQKMKEAQSVAVHVRRGDYVGNVFDILTPAYYAGAVEEIRRRITNPVFFVFSDDMSYIEKEFTFLGSYIPVHNAGKDSYMDMQLMAACRHMIIANSSFSYWGAVLGEKEGSIVIAPRRYKADEEIALARDGWLLLPVK